MSKIAPQTSEENSVIVQQRGEQWFVRIVEKGRVYENVFAFEASAAAYADGQRMRLEVYPGLESPGVEDSSNIDATE